MPTVKVRTKGAIRTIAADDSSYSSLGRHHYRFYCKFTYISRALSYYGNNWQIFDGRAFFGTLHSHFSAFLAARLFTKIIYKLHGFPKSIISDRDLLFISRFWFTLFKLRMSTACHTQTDGQTEVVNHCVQQYLRAFYHNYPKQWGKFLHWAEWHCNTSVHSSTRMSPFQMREDTTNYFDLYFGIY